MMLEIMSWNSDKSKIGIAFPDDGAHKRFASQFGSLDMIICGKVRDGDKRIITIKEGECKVLSLTNILGK